MKKSLFLLLFLTACSFLPQQQIEEPTPTASDEKACPEIWQPVCGKVEVQCITTPCNPVEQTFSNDCFAAAAHATDVVPGTCEGATNADITTQDVDYGAATGYLAAPAGDGPFPALILIHEWWGLNDNIRWYAEQFAKQGYIALAVDLYGGESTEDPQRAGELASAVREHLEPAFTNLRSAVDFLKTRDDVAKDHLASVGWCFGGGWSYQMAKNDLGVKASVMYYGQFAPEDDLSQMKALIIGHFGDQDQSIPVDDVKEFRAKLHTLNGEHEVYIYQNVGHGFARNLDNQSAMEAWNRTLTFLRNTLGGGDEPAPMVDAMDASPQTSSSQSEDDMMMENEEQRNAEGEDDVSALTPELSLAALGSMQLIGNNLELQELSRTDAYTHYAITYKSNGLTISGIMNIPQGEGPFPLVVLNHGYIDPAVYTRGRGLKREQDYFARNGFAVIHPDYRGHAFSDPSPDESGVYDATIEYSMDTVNAISAVRAADLPAVDASHVFMLGHSMGGGVTMNVAVTFPNLLDAVVLYAPVNTDAYQNFLRWRSDRGPDDHTIEVLGTREENPAAWDAMSSATYLDRLQTPINLFQGTLDDDVPPEWSDALDVRLTELGKEHEYVVYEGEKHEFIPQWEDFMQKAGQFFVEHSAT